MASDRIPQCSGKGNNHFCFFLFPSLSFSSLRQKENWNLPVLAKRDTHLSIIVLHHFDIHTKMIRFTKRLILPLAILFWVAILISSLFPSQYRKHTYNSAKHDTPIRIAISHPFKNNSKGTGQSWTHLGKGHLDTLHTSRNTVPLAVLQLSAHCSNPVNKFTNHLRLPNLLYNISMRPRLGSPESRTFWNPTIFALPYWAKNQYLIVSMVYLKDRGYRANVLCEANICHPRTENRGIQERVCTEEDLEVLGSNGGLRCANTPMEVYVPPTPAESCQGDQEGLADIPGFHDPRIFYSGRGEPILMVSSQYASLSIAPYSSH